MKKSARLDGENKTTFTNSRLGGFWEVSRMTFGRRFLSVGFVVMLLTAGVLSAGFGLFTSSAASGTTEIGGDARSAFDEKSTQSGTACVNSGFVSTPGQAGSLDITFNGTGIVTTPIGSGPGLSRSVAIQSDGKIVAAGLGYNGSNNDFALVRYNTDGTLDTSFNGTGKVMTPIGTATEQAQSVAIQSDGKIVAAGYSINGFDSDFAVVRYNTDGTLDTSFNGTGKVTTSFGTNYDSAYAVAIQSDGKIIAAGGTEVVANNDIFALVRYNSDGTLDTSFNGTGKVTTLSTNIAYSVVVQSDGKIVAAGGSSTLSTSDFALVRYNTDGTLDTSFNGTGKVTTPIGTEFDAAASVAIQSDGKLVAAGGATGGGMFDFALVRYNTDGTLDTAFNGSGKVTTSIGSGVAGASSVVIQSDGKIVTAGYASRPGFLDYALVRYNSDGALDTSFNGSGKVTTQIGNGNNQPFSLAIQSDGKIVVAGYSTFGSNQYFTVVRYNGANCSPAPPGLISWYSADNNANDSRSRNNAALVNGATYANGNVGQAFSLDGITQYVSAPASSSLDVGTSPNGMTIEGWIRPTNLSVARPILEWSTTGNSAGSIGVHLYASVSSTMSGQGNLYANFRVGNVDKVIYSPINALTVNTFQHVAAAYDRATGNASLYVNGTAVTLNGGPSTTVNIGLFNPNTSGNLYLGARVSNEAGDVGLRFAGLLDEIGVFNRTLTAAEIQAIVNAGAAGKCKPTATVSASGQVGWWSGDGNVNDIAGTNNGTLQNGAGFAVGQVGQAFQFGIGGNQQVLVPDNASLDLTNAVTIETWISPQQVGGAGNNSTIAFKGSIGGAAGESYGLQFFSDRSSSLRLSNGSTIQSLSSAATLPLNAFSHIVGTYDGTTMKFYVNGVLTNSAPSSLGTLNNSAGPLSIGSNGIGPFVGILDEVSIYNRALSDAEIASIFNAGIAGKLKDNATPVGGNVVVNTKSDATVTFPIVTSAGITQQIPLDLALFPALPVGSTPTGLAYDIATTATFTGSPTVCFTLPALSQAQFSNLGVLHLESGVWVDRATGKNTSTRTICATTPSLSPFVIAQVLAPTAATVPVGGRVLTADGWGIRNVWVSISDSAGNMQRTQTSSFGYYRFDEVSAGETYVVSVRSKRYQFSNPTRVVSVSEGLSDVDFTADPQ